MVLGITCMYNNVLAGPLSSLTPAIIFCVIDSIPVSAQSHLAELTLLLLSHSVVPDSVKAPSTIYCKTPCLSVHLLLNRVAGSAKVCQASVWLDTTC